MACPSHRTEQPWSVPGIHRDTMGKLASITHGSFDARYGLIPERFYGWVIAYFIH
jgi:hypothetical protein